MGASPSQPTNGSSKAFFAYPSYPTSIGQSIRAAIEDYRAYTSTPVIEPWEEMNIYGRFISPTIRESIDSASILIADITELNLNVLYELGLAVAKGRKILLTKNKSIISPYSMQELGLFDTIGYKEYQNSKELAQILRGMKEITPIQTPNVDPDMNQPIYVVDAKYKTDLISHVTSRIKKANLNYRIFDPEEKNRLSAFEAIEQVAKSIGVVTTILPDTIHDHLHHNARSAFVDGLADGMNKILTVMHIGDAPAPMDMRDFVTPVKHPKDVEACIHDFALKVTAAFQTQKKITPVKGESILAKVSIGASSAENELKSLPEYYLETDEYQRTERGETRIVVGRKGSGKTAIFYQVREYVSRNPKNIIIDLKPDGYKLLKFKDSVLSLLKTGTQEHAVMAFWEYVLLLEICHKLLSVDKTNHLRNAKLFEPYNKLLLHYETDEYVSEGDFSQRLSQLLAHIETDYKALYGEDEKVSLSEAQITELIHKHDVKTLREEIEEYLQHKDSIWLLIDNLDKGWPSHGLQAEDLTLIRELLEATRKLERQFSKNAIDAHTIVFLRNDVYELLIKETPDRGKEAKAMIDWRDPDLLRELVRRRLLSNECLSTDVDDLFQTLWQQLFISHHNGEETSQYLIDRSLMRPRHLIDLINNCKSYAVNLGHKTIQSDDIKKGLYAYSTDLVANINLEITDIYPKAENILYAFIEAAAKMPKFDLEQLFLSYQIDINIIDEIIEILLWHGVLGLSRASEEPQYIYNFNYDFQLLKGFIRKIPPTELRYCINPAFRPALNIEI